MMNGLNFTHKGKYKAAPDRVSLGRRLALASGLALLCAAAWLPGSILTAENPLRLQHVRGILDPRVRETVYPAYYDLRQQNRAARVRQFYTPLRLNPIGVYYSLESCSQPPNGTITYFEPLLETHLAQYDNARRNFASLEAVVAGLTAWAGPARSAGQYDSSDDVLPGETCVHVQEIVMLPQRDYTTDPDDLKTIKWFIMNHGAVCANNIFAQFVMHETKYGYYYFGDYDPGSNYEGAVAIVGWDDNFPVENFKYPPPVNGAFIVQLYYGETVGEKGYAYISYYDNSLIPRLVIPRVESHLNHGALYQYDSLGPTDAVGGDTPVYWGANVFTASDNRPLDAVGFYLADAHSTVNIAIYKNVSPGTGATRMYNSRRRHPNDSAPVSPVNGEPAAQKSASFIYPGYYTVKLDAPVPLAAGERFSTVIRFNGQKYTKPVLIERPIPSINSGSAASPGQSFISPDGRQWRDLTEIHPNSNVCVKAFSVWEPLYPIPQTLLTAEKWVKRIWTVRKRYTRITLSIPNYRDTTITEAKIWKRDHSGGLQLWKTVKPDDFTNGGFTILDDAVDVQKDYYYLATVHTPDPRGCGKSAEIFLPRGL